MFLKLYFVLVLRLAFSEAFNAEDCVTKQNIEENKSFYKYKQDSENDNENYVYERGYLETMNNKDTLWKLVQRLLFEFIDKTYEDQHQNDNYLRMKCQFRSNKYNFLLKNPHRNLVGSNTLKYGRKYLPFATLGPEDDPYQLNIHKDYSTQRLPEMWARETQKYTLKLKTLNDLLCGFPSNAVETLWKARRKLYGTVASQGKLNSLGSHEKLLWNNIPNLKSFPMHNTENVIIATKFLLDNFLKRLPYMKFKNGFVTTKRKYSNGDRFFNVKNRFQAATKTNSINLIDVLSLYSENDGKYWNPRMVNNQNSNSLRRQYDRRVKHEDFLNIGKDYVNENTISEMFSLLKCGRTRGDTNICSKYRIQPKLSLSDSVIEHATNCRKRLQDNKRWLFSKTFKRCETNDDNQCLKRRKNKLILWRDGFISLIDSAGNLNKFQSQTQIFLPSFKNEIRNDQGERELRFLKTTNNNQLYGDQNENDFPAQNDALSYKPLVKRGFSMLTRLRLFSALDQGKDGYFNSRRLKFPNNGPIIYLNDNNVISAETRAMLRPLGTPLRWG